MLQRIKKVVQVKPSIPPELKPLEEIAKNFWWCWHSQAIELFQSIDVDMWVRLHHNPYAMLGELETEHIERLVNDDAFLMKMESVYNELQKYLIQGSRYRAEHHEEIGELVAYFSAEFGIHESFPNYSGGLGILAGDHLKSASDLGLPLVGVGLLYKNGYFTQYLNEDGWQQEDYPMLDFYNLPIDPVLDENGNPLVVDVDFPGRKVYAEIWRANVGRVSLFLLDTNLPVNSEADRQITDKLYGGDKEHRIQQEMVLGIGGVRALKKMGFNPTVFHMNEGHSAFMTFERIRCFITEYGMSYHDAYQLVKASTVFTTHTPVPAGNEVFPDSMISRYLFPFLETFKTPLENFLDLGRLHRHSGENFGMTVFALRIAARSNGVSLLHGRVSRNMWRDLWDNLYPDEVPIEAITNGVHLPSWVSDEMDRLFRRYIGPDWVNRSHLPETWLRINNIPDNELWRSCERLKERLVGHVRKTVIESMNHKRYSSQDVEDANNLLDPDALTIGFSRRFATYKRATLLFKDREKLKEILANKQRPVQFIFAGKAHPHDMEGKNLIKEIVHFAREAGFKNRIIFLENYDIRMARYLVQGVDVWLNTPMRPHEASGTSGMKAVINGGINLSVLDGWWAEAYAENSNIGWAIGAGEEYSDLEYQDYVESRALYDTLEQHVIPAFYERGPDGLPKKWIAIMKNSISYGAPRFNTDRMVRDYYDKMYYPTGSTYSKLAANSFQKMKELSDWSLELHRKWEGVRVLSFGAREDNLVSKVMEAIEVVAEVELAGLKPEDLQVSLVYGKESSQYNINDKIIVDMKVVKHENNRATYAATFKPRRSGGYTYTIRIVPDHPDIIRKMEPGYIKWA